MMLYGPVPIGVCAPPGHSSCGIPKQPSYWARLSIGILAPTKTLYGYGVGSTNSMITVRSSVA